MRPIDIMKQAYASNYRGSISELIQQQLAAEQSMQEADIASTQQEAETGLLEGPPRSMVIPGAESITTQGMDYPIDITTMDSRTGMVQDVLQNVQPGQLVNTGKGVDVLETPSLKLGGSIRSSATEKMRKFNLGGKKC
jgi:hypothetical protein